jgi:hypothetical protein
VALHAMRPWSKHMSEPSRLRHGWHHPKVAVRARAHSGGKEEAWHDALEAEWLDPSRALRWHLAGQAGQGGIPSTLCPSQRLDTATAA